MGKLFWYLNRLQAMDLQEVCWRVQQRLLVKAEKRRFGKQRVRVDGEVWNDALRSWASMQVLWESTWTTRIILPLLKYIVCKVRTMANGRTPSATI